MDNELHTLENRVERILVVDDGLSEIEGLLKMFDVYRHVYEVPFERSAFRIKKDSQPPSMKPVESRDEHDWRKLEKAKEKRLKRAAKQRGMING